MSYAQEIQTEKTLGNISNTDGNTGEENITQEITLFAEPIVHTKNLAITNALLTSWMAVLIIIVLSVILRLKLKSVPGKFQKLTKFTKLHNVRVVLQEVLLVSK